MSLKTWLHTRTWQGIKRGQIFKEFLHGGLLPFIESMGYSVGTAPNILYGYIVTGLYENRDNSTLRSKWNMDYCTKDWIQEDQMHYHDTVTTEAWNSFWDEWNDIDEFSEDSFRGRDRRSDIEGLIWRQIDLENSYQTDVLYDIMYDDYEIEPDENTKKIDAYLLDTAGWNGQRG